MSAAAAGAELCTLLRHWRGTRGMSQLELSAKTGISQRHLSFVESGRSAPSRETVLIVAEALEVPLRERNTLLLAAGYAPLYGEQAWDAEQLAMVTRAIERTLRLHDPFPAVMLDRHWNVLVANESAPRFFRKFFALDARPRPRNLLHLMFDPRGMRPFVKDWETLARSLIQRVYRESIGHVLDAGTRKLLAELQAYPGVEAEWRLPRLYEIESAAPAIGYRFVWQGRELSYFSMITTVCSPVAVAAEELRIESMFPVDAATEALHQELFTA